MVMVPSIQLLMMLVKILYGLHSHPCVLERTGLVAAAHNSIAIPTDCKHDEHEGRYDHGTHEGVSVCVSVFVFEATLFFRLVWRNQKDH